MPARTTLITGGVRSGKSFKAESLLQKQLSVTYLAPGPIPDPVADPEWAERIAAHRARRPAHWITVETAEVAQGVLAADGAVLLDCLGTWVTALMDECDAWSRPGDQWRPDFDRRVEDLAAAWQQAPGPLIAVTNEVGMGVVPDHRSGRLFRDLLGLVNQRIAAVSDDVLLVVAGRVLRL
ncbi:adenosylcobinamide kinase/adenosylcobinamide-phosphate guanylyltransferase [Nakamurella sp. UYEF19]|uniref:bifunctional adenosylcobinamide kinase/adenosylcobinamide-phosphate guanylyltransferase n=1 Tax=Nakamurella sp. UYEF19 TaxID=1756392 RepID=UPI003395374F